MHFVCSTQLRPESLSKQTLCCVPCCRLPLCTPLPQGNFKPFLAAKGKKIPRNYSRQFRSSPHIKLRATAEQLSVYEYITLFKVKDGAEVDLAESMLDKFWSLQYMIPAGVLNGFAGPVKLMYADNPRLSMTHALHLRFGSMQHIDQFRQHAKLQQVRNEADDMCDTMLEMVLAGTVPRDIEAIFRKGSDWDVGMDHIMILQAREDATKQEMQKFLKVLAELSSSPAINAMQTTHGTLHALSESAIGTHVVFTRLSLQEQLDALLLSPSHRALIQGDSRLPARAIASYAMTIAPAQKQQSRSPDGGGVLGVSKA